MINGSIKKTPFRVERRLVFYLIEIATSEPSVSFADSSPMYGFCDPNRRFGQNLTLGKGAFAPRNDKWRKVATLRRFAPPPLGKGGLYNGY